MTIINTNTRSICPIINSVVEAFDELEASFGVFTETWLSDGPELQDKIDDLSHGSGIGMLTCNREKNDMGFSHGGVAILYRESICTFKAVAFPNPESFEVVVGSARFAGYSSQLIVVACYLPPTYVPVRGKAALCYIRDIVTQIKRNYRSPYIVIAGDFNNWRLEEALADFVDLTEAPVGPTRGSRSIDRLFSNFETIRSAFTVPSLEADDPSQGDQVIIGSG